MLIREIQEKLMTQSARAAFKSVTLYTDSERYTMIQLPVTAVTAAAGVLAEIGEPFCALLVDKDEVTLILTESDLDTFARRLPGHVKSTDSFRLITMDGELDPNLTGFMALIASALAQADVWILPLGAYTRDHVLVKESQFELAMTTLGALQQSL
jgi:hypothetical protein